MEPAYTDGDWLLVESILAGPPVERGDVVLARRNERLVCHRVVDLDDGVLLTRGDACIATDPPLPSGLIVGRVVDARRGTGWRPRWRRVRRNLIQLLTRPSRGDP